MKTVVLSLLVMAVLSSCRTEADEIKDKISYNQRNIMEAKDNRDLEEALYDFYLYNHSIGAYEAYMPSSEEEKMGKGVRTGLLNVTEP